MDFSKVLQVINKAKDIINKRGVNQLDQLVVYSVNSILMMEKTKSTKMISYLV